MPCFMFNTYRLNPMFVFIINFIVLYCPNMLSMLSCTLGCSLFKVEIKQLRTYEAIANVHAINYTIGGK